MQSDGASLQGEQESFSALHEQAHDDYEDRMILQSYQNRYAHMYVHSLCVICNHYNIMCTFCYCMCIRTCIP